jgi:hypothetical protein
MKRLLSVMLFAGALLVPGQLLAADLDNNGIQNDETHVPGEFVGNQEGGALVYFPTSADTWDVTFYPYWWNAGDTVFGVHNPPVGAVTHADVALKISYTVLNSGGHVDLDFRINGTTVGSLVITEAHGTGYVYGSFDFPAVSPPFELRYYETNTVASGAGSVSFDETGLCTVEFSGSTPVVESTWGKIKELYKN